MHSGEVFPLYWFGRAGSGSIAESRFYCTMVACLDRKSMICVNAVCATCVRVHPRQVHMQLVNTCDSGARCHYSYRGKVAGSRNREREQGHSLGGNDPVKGREEGRRRRHLEAKTRVKRK